MFLSSCLSSTFSIIVPNQYTLSLLLFLCHFVSCVLTFLFCFPRRNTSFSHIILFLIRLMRFFLILTTSIHIPIYFNLCLTRLLSFLYHSFSFFLLYNTLNCFILFDIFLFYLYCICRHFL